MNLDGRSVHLMLSRHNTLDQLNKAVVHICTVSVYPFVKRKGSLV